MPPAADHIADAVVAVRPPWGEDNLTRSRRWLELNLPNRRIAGRLNDLELAELIRQLRNLVHQTERTSVAAYVELGYVLTKVKDTLPHGRFGPWLAGANINKRTGQCAMRRYTAIGDDAGRVCMHKLARLLSEHGYAKFKGVTADEICLGDLSSRIISAAIQAAHRGGRAVEDEMGDSKSAARCAFDDHPDLREDAKRAELSNGISLSSRDGGAASSAAPVEHLRAEGGVRAPAALGTVLEQRGAGVGGGAGGDAVGRGAGGIDTRVVTGDKGTAGARGSLGTPRPPAGGPGVGAVQLTLDARYEAARLCRDVAGRIDRGELSDGDVEFVAESLRLLGSRLDGGQPVIPHPSTQPSLALRARYGVGSGGAVGVAAPTSRT